MKTESGWAFLEPGLIAKTIGYLIDTRCWRRNAPSLRLVNKHWCLETDFHISAIAPHHSRDIVSQDLLSLVKFPRLCSLDATRFIRAYEAEKLPSIKVLSQLPNLSSLKLASDWNGIGFGVLVALNRVSNLVLETEVQSRVVDKDLRMLSHLPLKRLSIRCPIHFMGSFFERCRSLTHLDAQVPSGDMDFPFDASYLNGIEVMKLTFRHTGRNFDLPYLGFLSAAKSLRELDVLSFFSVDLDWLVHLPLLKTLKIAIAGIDVLTTPAFLHVLEKLKVFELDGPAWSSIALGNIIQRASNVQCLSIRGFKIDCNLLKENMKRLEYLAVEKCELQNGQSVFSDLKPLKGLAFQSASDPFTRYKLGEADLSVLTVLKISLNGMDRISTISRLKRLRVLGLRTMHPLSIQALNEVGSLPKLMTLGLSPPFPESAATLFLKMEIVDHLEELYLADELSNFIPASLQLLKDRASHLKIDTRTFAFDAFMRSL